MKYSIYPEYKDSGVEWIGGIPVGWDVEKLLSKVDIKTKSISSDEIKNEKEVFHYSIPNFDKYGDGHVEEAHSVDSNKYLINENLILVSKLNPRKSRVLFVKKNPDLLTISSTEFVPIKVQEIEPKFLIYFLKSEVIRQFFDSSTNSVTNSHKRINPHMIPRIILGIPSKEEQTQIATFLDNETSKIDQIIRKYEELIELLKEKRTALINHTVTKGLDSDTKMKDSGVEWFREIPEGWEVDKIKHKALVWISNVDKKSKDDEPNVLLCNYTDVYKNEFITSDFDFMKATASDDQISKLSLKKGDVIITKDSETAEDIAVPALVNEDLINVVCGYHLALIRSNSDELDGNFLFRLLESSKINDQFTVAANGVTRFGVGTYPIKNSYLSIPPIDEQNSIVEFLNEQTLNMDLLTQKIQNQIELLKEYKISLISHAVTGKIDVRGEVQAFSPEKATTEDEQGALNG